MENNTPLSPNWQESDRLQAVNEYYRLNAAFEHNFDEVVQLASQICETPVSLVTVVDVDQQWFKAAVGTEIRQMPLNMAFCTKAIRQQGILTIEDASKDPHFQNNPLVTSDPNVRFYAGVPLITPDGLPLGTLCVLDFKPRTLSPLQQNTLKVLAEHVMAQVELRHQLAQQKRGLGPAVAIEKNFRAI